VDYSIVDGKVLIEEGRITTVDIKQLIPRHNTLSQELINA